MDKQGRPNPPLEPIVYDKRTSGFITTMDKSSSQIDCASKFETDIISLVNLVAKAVDQIFAWHIAPFEETSHECPKMSITQLMESFQIVDTDNNVLYHFYPLQKLLWWRSVGEDFLLFEIQHIVAAHHFIMHR